jgi:hypothetical protein
MSFFNLEVLKGKLTKSIWIMAHVKDKKIWKTKKITIHMDLWKYGQILTIQKSLIIKQW